MNLLLRCVVFLSISGLAWAQAPATSLTELQSRVRTGDSLDVTDAAGHHTKARFADLSLRVLGVTKKGVRQEFAVEDIREIRRRQPDRLWDGILIGMSVGIGASFLSPPLLCDLPDDECAAAVMGIMVPVGAGIGAVTGLLMDKMITKSVVVYSGRVPTARVSIWPIIGNGREGFALSVRF